MRGAFLMSEVLNGKDGRGRRVAVAKSRLANESKRAKRDPAVGKGPLLDARRALAAAKLEAYIAQVVTSAPELTPEQAARLASLLRGTDA